MKVAAIALLLAALLGLGQAFTAPRSAVRVMGVMPRKVAVMQPQGMGAVAQPLPRSAASGTVTMGLFGLGTPELVVIGVIAAAVIGPKNLKKLAGDFGKVAGELKDVSGAAVGYPRAHP
uniref:Uncharacterized protein n=1 Tax=Phaeomonas parva TaxID=124430 RepID=A0A7S1TX42_9STRA|mmetsp:Transcript_19612/g.59372  ORF Transcript_19612/g.59372 Transcript_19612/m.59372 type:complete len:119 (+) Transcript_19612:113-469(+)